MAYIGNIPAEKFTSVDIQNFTVSATANYTLDRPVANENEIELFINNVRQHPGSGKAYTASGTALTLSEATAGTDTMYCVYQGKARQTVTPATSSVTNDMLAGSIAEGKLAGSIGLDKLSATGTKSSSTFLRGDNTFASAGLSNWSENSGNLLPSNASYGIYLGVNSATSSNLLDDYEEGSWTPVVTTGGANPSYTTQHGRYVRVGNTCTVYMKLDYTSSSGNTGQWGGLPFNASNEQSGAMDQYISILDGRNTTVYQALLIANDNKWYLRANGTLSGGLQSPSDFSGTRFYMQGTYITT